MFAAPFPSLRYAFWHQCMQHPSRCKDSYGQFPFYVEIPSRKFFSFVDTSNRMPNNIGPTLYSAFVVYRLVLGCPAWVYLGTHWGGGVGAVSETQVWMALGVTTGMSLCGISLMWTFMNASHRHTFYRPRPYCRLVDEIWEVPYALGQD